MEMKDKIIDLLAQIEDIAGQNKVWGGNRGYILLGLSPKRQSEIMELAREGIEALRHTGKNQYMKEAQRTEDAVKEILPGIDCCE